MEPHQVRADKGDIALTERQPSAADSAGRRQTSCGLRRVQIQTDDVIDLLGEQRIIREFEPFFQVGFEGSS